MVLIDYSELNSYYVENSNYDDIIMGLQSYCDIEGLRLSSRSLDALNYIDTQAHLANYLSEFTVILPLVEIFSGKATVNKTFEKITRYDWDKFGNAMTSIPLILRDQVRAIAQEQELFTSGKEQKFWRCVFQASL